MLDSGVRVDADKGLSDPSPADTPAQRNSTLSRRLVAIGAIASIAGLAVLLGAGLSRQDDDLGAAALDAGKPAPAFSLPTFQGEELRLSDYAGQPVFLYFWASWCLPCRDEAPILEESWRAYREQGIAFVGVNIQDREADARSFLSEFNLTFPSAIDKSGRVYIDYGVSGVPEAFFIKADGTFQRRWIGPLDQSQLDEQLQELLRG